jgi:uncharacterized membrane protein (UPF0127 family)
MQVYNKTKQKMLAADLKVADTFFTRVRGLLGTKSLPEGTALWIKDCPSVHTFFMSFNIDVIFLNDQMQVTRVVKNLPPWRCTRFFQFKNKSCIELSSSTQISDLVSQGDFLDVRS